MHKFAVGDAVVFEGDGQPMVATVIELLPRDYGWPGRFADDPGYRIFMPDGRARLNGNRRRRRVVKQRYLRRAQSGGGQ